MSMAEREQVERDTDEIVLEREQTPLSYLCLTKVTTVSDSLSLHLRGLRLSNRLW